MFDLRYHVASLAAVFVALLIGILVGVAMSGKVDDAEKRSLESEVNRLDAELDSAREGRSSVTREQNAIKAFVKNAYPSLIADRLRGKRIAVLFVGTVDAGVRRQIERTLADAGASTPVRMQALKIPLDAGGGRDAELNGELRQYRGAGLDELGRALSRELVDGGDTPGWNALTSVLVVEKAGSFRRFADGVVVVRTVEPQKDETAQFLSGLYAGLADIDVPTIGVETSDVSRSAVEAWSEAGLSTVDDIDAPAGRLALALLLAGSPNGNYGVKESAGDGIVPPVEPLPAPCEWLIPQRSSSPPGTRRRAIAATVATLRNRFPGAEVIVADDGSRDADGGAGRGGRRPCTASSPPRQGAGAHHGRAGWRRQARCCSATPTSSATCGRCPRAAPTSRSLRLPRGRAAGSGSSSGRRER